MGRTMSQRPGSVIQDLVERIADARPVLLGVDFDGTLAPIVAHPDDAAADSRAVAALEALAAAPGITVAIISGRGWADLHARIGDVSGVTLIGGHGTETGPGGTTDDLTMIEKRLSAAVEELPGAWVEHKNHSLGFHYRAVDAVNLDSVLDELREWARDDPDLYVLESKRILEVGARPLSKATAVETLKATLQPELVVYIGDDTTDESVFEAMSPGDLGIKVGGGDTAATARLAGPEGVTRFLEEWALRAQAASETIT